MVLRVADIVKIVGTDLYIATDSKLIKNVALRRYKTILRSKKCLTGTDR